MRRHVVVVIRVRIVTQDARIFFIFFGSCDGRRMRGLLSLVCDEVDGYGVVVLHRWSLIGSKVSPNSLIICASRCCSRKR